MPHRADISLLHELIHASTCRRARSKRRMTWSTTAAIDAVDAPFMEESFGEEKPAGVREEEYATVGLGPYRVDP